MPVLTCKKCASKIRVPETLDKAVACPKCQNLITPRPAPSSSVQPPQPVVRAVAKRAPKPLPLDEIEVEEDEPAPKKARPVARRTKPVPEDTEDDPPRPATRKARPARDEEDQERPSARKVRPARRDDDEEEEDDRPRPSRRGRDEDDRPRSRSRVRDEDDEDEDDDEDYEDEDEWEDEVPSKVRRARSQARQGATGSLLMCISFALYMVVFGLWALGILLSWAGVQLPMFYVVLAGIVGLLNLIVGGLGIGFCLAGPKKGQGISIAAAVVATLHLLCVTYLFLQLQSLLAGNEGFLKANPLSGLSWISFTTMIGVIDLLPGIAYISLNLPNVFSGLIFPIVTGVLEIVRVILMLMILKTYAEVAKDYSAETFVLLGLKGLVVACISIPIVLFIGIIIMYVAAIGAIAPAIFLVLFCFGVHALSMLIPVLSAQMVKVRLKYMATE